MRQMAALTLSCPLPSPSYDWRYCSVYVPVETSTRSWSIASSLARVVVVLQYPWQVDTWICLSHAMCICTSSHLIPALVNVFLVTKRQHYPSDQRRQIHKQVMLRSLSKQYYWSTQQPKKQRFNRSICQGW